MKTNIKGSVTILLSAACFASGAILIKFALEEGISALTITWARFLIAALLMAPVYLKYSCKHKPGWKTHLSLLIIGGILNASLGILLVFALEVLSAPVTILVLYLYPVFTTVLAFFVLNEQITPMKGAALTAALAGVALVVYAPQARVNTTGVIMVVAAALINSVIMVSLKRVVAQVPPLVSSAAMLSWGAVTVSALGLVLQVPLLSGLTARGLGFLTALAIVSTILSIVFLSRGLSMVEASLSSIIMTAEPLFTAVLAAVFLGEHLTVNQSLGGVLIVGSLVMLAVGGRKNVLPAPH